MPEKTVTRNAQPQPERHRRRWYQYSLRTLLVVMLLASVGMSWVAVKLREARRQREATEVIEKLGGLVSYDWQLNRRVEPPGPKWLRNLLGSHAFQTVVSVRWLGTKTNLGANDLVILEHLPELRDLEVQECGLTVATMARLGRLRSLESLKINAKLDHAVWNALGQLSSLKELDLSFCNVQDSDLVILTGMNQIRRLDLSNTRITDAGLVHLHGLSKLELLDLGWCKVTDAGLAHLREFANLRYLGLADVDITATAWREFRAFPRLEELHIHPRRLTEESRADLRALQCLQILQLDSCSDETLELFREALPGVWVYSSARIGGGMVKQSPEQDYEIQ